MFATLLGALPRPPLGDEASTADLVEAAVRAQESAGLEPITDGGFGQWDRPVDAWHLAAGLTDRAVKQAVIGPYTHGWSDERGDETAHEGVSAARVSATLARAEALNTELRSLAAAGCPFIEIHEPAATSIGASDAERTLFRDAHLRLLDGLAGVHCSLALTGGNADAAGIDTLLAAPYASLAVDLIAGPDNWRLVVAVPGDLGIVCGAMSTAAGSDDGPELLLWAAAYAASTSGRGPDRVGLATASSLAGLTWADATLKMDRLGKAVRLVDVPPDERAEALDPRAIDIRSAALGRQAPRPTRRRR